MIGNPIAAGRCDRDDDSDKYFLDLLTRITNIRRSNGRVAFFDFKFQEVFSASRVAENSPKKQDQAPAVESGTYIAALPSIEVQFEDDSLHFQGCRQNRFGYLAKSNGAFNISTQNNQRSCAFDSSNWYTTSVGAVTRYRQNESGFSLLDKDGN